MFTTEQTSSLSQGTNNDQLFYAFLKHTYEEPEENKEALKAHLERLLQEDFSDTPFHHIEGYRKLLALLIITKSSSKLKDSFSKTSEEIYQKLNSTFTWDEFQLLSAYKLLINHLLEKNTPNQIHPITGHSGYAPLETGHHWSFGEIPLQPYHAELGILWTLIGIETNSKKFLAAGEKIAKWQLQLTDNNFFPLSGLFTHEVNGNPKEILGWNNCLFHLIGNATNKENYLYAIQGESQQAHPLTTIVQSWKQFPTAKTPITPPPRPINSKCEELGMILHRDPKKTVSAHLFGARTSIGSYTVDQSLAIVGYGPQYQPLGECAGFGVESSEYTQNKFPSVSIKVSQKGFNLSGYTKLPGKKIYSHPYSIAGNSSHSECWLDINQELEEDRLTISLELLEYQSTPPLSFLFFVKAEEIKISKDYALKPNTLDRYVSKIVAIELKTQEKSLSISPNFTNGEMEVIPLAGNENFWGSDFLIGYSVEDKELKHQWTISSSSL